MARRNSVSFPLDCIAVAGNISEYALIQTESGFFDQDLFRIKECGIYYIDVLPDNKFMSQGETETFVAVIEDKDGNQLPGREIDWSIGDNDIFTRNESASAGLEALAEDGDPGSFANPFNTPDGAASPVCGRPT